MALDLADHVHHLGLARALAPLVDNGERRIDALGQPARSPDAADVGRHHHHLADIEALLDVAHHHRGGVEVVGRDVEETLDLAGVEVERHHRSAPARVIRLATSLAEIGVRGPGLRSCRA